MIEDQLLELQQRARDLATRLGLTEEHLRQYRSRSASVEIDDLGDADESREGIGQNDGDQLRRPSADGGEDRSLTEEVDGIRDVLALLEERADYGRLTVEDVALADQISSAQAVSGSPMARTAERIVDRSVEARREYGYGYDPEDSSPHRRTDWDEVASRQSPQL